MTPPVTVVHLMRHGEVDNPRKVLYGRLPGYLLSSLGERMADTDAAFLAERDITYVAASPLERAQQTAHPVAQTHDLPLHTDDRLIEAGNYFEGHTVGRRDSMLRNPRAWPHLVNPFTPSWGEPYQQIASRMLAAIGDARRQAEGHEAVLVSHQLPIWTVRSRLEGRHLWHNPRRRECGLASLTSLRYAGDELSWITYTEPAAELIAQAAEQAGA